MKKIVSVIFLCITVFSLWGCIYRYRGKHMDLYSVAINNVFGADGSRFNGEVSYDPYIEIIETDGYGRVLFFYDEGYRSKYGTAIIVMQKSEDSFVYYYQDICYSSVILVKDDYWHNGDEGVTYKDIFTKEEIELLKEANDWEKPFNSEKCTKAAITDRKNDDGNIGINREDFDKAITSYVRTTEYNGKDTNSIYRYSIYCNTDKFGRELHYVYGIGSDVKGEGVSPDSEHQDFEFAIIFNPDKSCNIDNIIEITDAENCYEEVKNLKQKCGWDTQYN